jgi:Flp pilus assembly protein TadG
MNALRPTLRTFVAQRDGAAMAEAAIAAPVLFALMAAAYLLGSTLYNAQVIETAARDAARYLARTDTPAANEATARNLAVFGNVTGAGSARIRGLRTQDVTFAYGAVANPLNPQTGERTYRGADPIATVRVRVSWRSNGAGMWSFFGLAPFDYVAVNEQRVIGD